MQDLIRDLYRKYAPNENIDDKIKYVEENYGDDVSAFVNDFYSKYEPSKLNQDTVDYINENYLTPKPDYSRFTGTVPEISTMQDIVSTTPNVDMQGKPIKASYEQMRDIKGISQYDELKQAAQVVFSPTALAAEVRGDTDFLDVDESFKIALSTPVAWLSDARKSIKYKSELFDRYGIGFLSADISKEERKEIETKVNAQELADFYSPTMPAFLQPLNKLTSMSKPVKKYQEQVQKDITKYDGDIISALGKGNLFDAGSQIVNGMIQTAPTLVAAAGGAPALLTMGAGMYGSKFEEVFKDNPNKTVGLAMLNAGSTAAVEVAGGLVTQRLLFGTGIFAKGAGKKAVENLTKGSVGRLVNTITTAGLEGAEELAVEMTAEIIDRLTLKDQSYGDIYNDIGKIMRDKSDAFILGVAMGGTTSTMQNLMTSESALQEHAINLFMSKADRDYLTKKADNINKLQVTLNEAKTEDGKKIIENKIEKEVSDILNKRRKIQNNLKNLKQEELINLGNLTDKRLNKIKDYKSETNEEVKSEIKKEIDQLARSSSNIFNSTTKRRLNENIKFARKNKRPDEVVVYDNTDEFQDVYDSADPKESIDVSGVDGFYLNGVLHINRTASIETGAISVGSHELLHDIVKNVIRDANGNITPSGIALINNFRKQLSAKEIKIVQDRIDKNYRYNEDGTEKAFEDYAEEYLNIFHDAIVKKDIKYNATDGAWWKGVAGNFSSIFKRFGYDNASFKTGKSAYNFLLDYSDRASRGEDISDLVNKLKEEGRELDAQIEDTNPRDTDKLNDLKNKRKDKRQEVREAIAQQDIQKSVTSSNESEINKLGKNVTKEQWDAGKADEAIEELYDRLDGLVKSKIPRNQPPGFSAEDFVSETIFELIPHIRNFNPEVNDSLSGWINSQLSNKIGNVFRKGTAGTKDVFETDITEARKVAAEETAGPEVTTKPKARQIDPLDLARDTKLKEKYTKDIDVKIKDLDVDKLTFKNLKDLSADNTAKIFEVPAKKITDPTANLTKQEKENALKFIRANALDLISLLPEGAVVEAATEKLIGTSTGVPKSLLNKFYDKQPRITKGAGLSPYKLKENISKKQFLEAFGIVEGKKSTDFGPRTPEAQAVKAMMSLYGKLATNTAVRQNLKDKVSKEKLQDIAAGKNIIQLSVSQAKENINKLIGKPLDITNSNHISRIGRFFRETMPKYMNPAIILGRPSLLSPGNKVTTAFKRKFFFITNPLKGQTSDIIKKNNDAVAAGEINSIEEIKEEAYNNYTTPESKIKAEDERLIKVALSTKTSNKGDINKIKKNIDATADHNKGVGKLMNNILNIYKGEGDKALPEIYEILYHTDNNTSISRNAANVVGGQKKYEGSLTEEHKYQAIVWTQRAIEAMKNGTLDGFLKWSQTNYTQIVLDEKNDGFANKKYGDWNAKFDEHPVLKKAMDEAIKTGNFDNVPDTDIRYYNDSFYLNPNNIIEFGKTHAQKYKVVVSKAFENDPDVIKKQAEIIFKITSKQDIDFDPQAEIDKFIADKAKDIADARSKNYADFDFLFESMTLEEQVKAFRNIDKALELARDFTSPEKGISLFDFDQTLANTKEKVKFEMPDGTQGELSAQQFAEQAEKLEEKGATFDFSNFDKVKGATKGPFFELAQKIKGKFGNKDIFILTARPGAASPAIKAFLKSVGLDIKLENIIGLEDGRPAAKANFVIEKAAEGYNNFFFGDDVYNNVKMVQDVLDVVDVKRDVQQANIQLSKTLDSDFNEILSDNTGIDPNATFSDATARVRGANKDSFFKNIFIPYSAEDFMGLMYPLLGKGKKGDSQKEFFKKNLIDPFARATRNMNAAKQKIVNEYDKLKKDYKDVKKKLLKATDYNNYTLDQAIRVYIMDKNNIDIPGLSKRDKSALLKIVNENQRFVEYGDQVANIAGLEEGYIIPDGSSWLASTIESDLRDVNVRVNRAKYLKEWKQNVDIIFSEKNLNKLQALYGNNYREALEDILYRMEIGSNRVQGQNRLVNGFTEWINNSVGTIMFFNRRSAILQTLSTLNFINWSDNNPLKFAQAVANFPQYAKDFATIFNSDMLKERRRGLQTDVSASEIVNQAAGSKDKFNALVSYMLRRGFVFTQMADSFAIASGGAAFYRNRLNTYKKQGLSETEAKDKAFQDFQETSEVSQQSARPDLISQQQAGPLGRFILAFQNTPMQYTRLIKKAALDLKNGRGDAKTNISKILYYGAIQNFIFSALQSALFSIAFEDEEEEKDKEKYARVANSMADTILRGTGVYGAAASTLKNMALQFVRQEKKGSRADHAYTILEGVNLSPTIGSKVRKVYSATQAIKFNRDEISKKGFHIDNPLYEAVANTVSAGTNVPLDRALRDVQNARAALDKNNKAWQRIALVLGWNTWDLGIDNKPKKLAKKKKGEKGSNILW